MNSEERRGLRDLFAERASHDDDDGTASERGCAMHGRFARIMCTLVSWEPCRGCLSRSPLCGCKWIKCTSDQTTQRTFDRMFCS